MKRALTVLAALALTTTVAHAAPADSQLYGVWRNPKDTVHLEIKPCGDSACGYVVWAAEKAKADVRRGSGKELVGLQLLRDFAPADHGWRGKVFVPDINRTLSGAVRPVDAGHLEAKGCLLGSVLCKSQVWTRVALASR